MALGKTPTTLVSNQTITASGTYVSPSSLDLSGAISLEIGFKGTFDASTNAGARVEIFSDVTGANSSFTVGTNDDPVDAMDVSHVSGTKAKAAQFRCCSKYIKAKVTNLGNKSMTGVYVYAIPQTQ